MGRTLTPGAQHAKIFAPKTMMRSSTLHLPCMQINLFGAILRFDVSKTPGVFKDVFASTVGATDCAKFMHRPEGLTWGPKLPGHQPLLYVTGYTASAGDVTAKPPTPPPVNNAVRAQDGRQTRFFCWAPVGPGAKRAAALHCHTAPGRQQPYAGLCHGHAHAVPLTPTLQHRCHRETGTPPSLSLGVPGGPMRHVQHVLTLALQPRMRHIARTRRSSCVCGLGLCLPCLAMPELRQQRPWI